MSGSQGRYGCGAPAGVCGAPLRTYPSVNDQVCSGNGYCQYADDVGNVLSSCSIFDVFCRASCVCLSGYGGNDCSLSSSGVLARDASRKKMCDALVSVGNTQNQSPQLLDTLVGSLLGTFSPSEVVSLAAQTSCNNALTFLNNLASHGCGSACFKGAKKSTILFLKAPTFAFLKSSPLPFCPPGL